MKFGDMTPGQKRAAMKRAADELQKELQANSASIAAVLDSAGDDEPAPLDSSTAANKHEYEPTDKVGNPCERCGFDRRHPWHSYSVRVTRPVIRTRNGELS